MADNTPAAFNPATLQGKVEERIRASFVDLIPEEVWQGMVKAQIAAFTARTSRTNWEEGKASPLEQMVAAEVRRRFHETVKNELAKPEYNTLFAWDDTVQAQVPRPGAVVQQVVRDLAPVLVQSLFAGIIGEAVGMARNGFNQKLADIVNRTH